MNNDPDRYAYDQAYYAWVRAGRPNNGGDVYWDDPREPQLEDDPAFQSLIESYDDGTYDPKEY